MAGLDPAMHLSKDVDFFDGCAGRAAHDVQRGAINLAGTAGD